MPQLAFFTSGIYSVRKVLLRAQKLGGGLKPAELEILDHPTISQQQPLRPVLAGRYVEGVCQEFLLQSKNPVSDFICLVPFSELLTITR